jgi:tetratricopeptide (TPR) repeat protein
LQIMGGTRNYWTLAGEFRSSYELARQAIDRPGAQVRTRARARALRALAQMGMNSGRLEAATDALTEGLSIAREVSDARGIAEALANLATAELDRGDSEHVLQHVNEALTLARGARLSLVTGYLLNTLGAHLQDSGDLDGAQAAYEEAAESLRQSNSPVLNTAILLNQTMLATARDNLPRARQSLMKALDLVGESDFSAFPGTLILDATSGYLAAAGAWYEAARLRGTADTLMAKIGAVPESVDTTQADTLQDRARESLGNAQYEAALKEGGKLSLAAALAAARSALGAAGDESQEQGKQD